MKVVIAHESNETNAGRYHVVNDAESASLCGSINEESPFAANIARVLSQESAERRGFDLCGNCSYIVDRRQDASHTADE